MKLPTKLIALTQRTSFFNFGLNKFDIVDHNWVNFLKYCGYNVLLIPNSISDVVEYINLFNIEGVILTGGGAISNGWRRHDGKIIKYQEFDNQEIQIERDKIELEILNYSVDCKLPVLGVCRGMQFINLYYGGVISKIEGHVGITHDLISHMPNYKFDDKVSSYHDFGIFEEGLGSNLLCLATSGESIEAFKHNTYPHCGIMWHPERKINFSRNDMLFFSNFFKENNLKLR